MSKPSVLISIDTDHPTDSSEYGRQFIGYLIAEDAGLMPELVSESENFRERFVNMDLFVEQWWARPYKTYFDGQLSGEGFHGPMWKRKSAIANRGMVSHGFSQGSDRLSSTEWFECRWNARVNFSHLFENWVSLARPNIGLLHLFTDVERNALKFVAGSWFSTGSFGGPAKPGLPEIGWAMAYGPEYAAEVDVDRITSAGFKVSQIGGAQVVQVTDKLSDVVDNYPYFAERRAQLKALFRPDLFWIK